MSHATDSYDDDDGSSGEVGSLLRRSSRLFSHVPVSLLVMRVPHANESCGESSSGMWRDAACGASPSTKDTFDRSVGLRTAIAQSGLVLPV